MYEIYSGMLRKRAKDGEKGTSCEIREENV